METSRLGDISIVVTSPKGDISIVAAGGHYQSRATALKLLDVTKVAGLSLKLLERKPLTDRGRQPQSAGKIRPTIHRLRANRNSSSLHQCSRTRPSGLTGETLNPPPRTGHIELANRRWPFLNAKYLPFREPFPRSIVHRYQFHPPKSWTFFAVPPSLLSTQTFGFSVARVHEQ